MPAAHAVCRCDLLRRPVGRMDRRGDGVMGHALPAYLGLGNEQESARTDDQGAGFVLQHRVVCIAGVRQALIDGAAAQAAKTAGAGGV